MDIDTEDNETKFKAESKEEIELVVKEETRLEVKKPAKIEVKEAVETEVMEAVKDSPNMPEMVAIDDTRLRRNRDPSKATFDDAFREILEENPDFQSEVILEDFEYSNS